ncbi:MAG: PAS domain-containing sensor histidine kinase [Bauldia sp.]|nr:PAS domain-containing sensor histidine kinase [Bauldia sp.]
MFPASLVRAVLQLMPMPAPLLRFLDGQIGDMPKVEPEVRDGLRSALLRALVLACLGLAAFPAWVALGGPGGIFAALGFFWALAPIPLILALGRSGRPEAAAPILAAALGGVVAWAAAMTGGLASPLVAWLVLVPIAGGVLAGRRALLRSGAGALLGLAFVSAVDLGGASFVPAWTLAGPLAGLCHLVLLGVAVLLVAPASRLRPGPGRRSDDHVHRMIADNAIDLVTRHGAGAAVDFASPSSETLFGIRPADLAGDGLFRRINVADRPKYLSAISDVLAGRGHATIEFRLRCPSADGPGESQVWVEMRCRPVSGADGRPIAAIAVTRDISGRKATEAEGEEARVAAESANAAKSRFLAHMSHELRTPLNSIVGFSEFLSSDRLGPFDEARWREYARLIRQSGEHLLKVVNNLLDVSKIEAGMFAITPEPLALGPIVEECTAIMQPQAGQRSLIVETHFEADLPEVLADRHACRQILINLLSNAVKFSRVGGTIAITARDTGTAVALSVEDRGIGVAENDLPRLGIPFFQVDSAYNRNYEGTGLGLSIVKGLVSLHGGEVTIRSTAGLGTTVTVTLPLVADAAGTGTTEGIAGLVNRERKIA